MIFIHHIKHYNFMSTFPGAERPDLQLSWAGDLNLVRSMRKSQLNNRGIIVI